MKPTKTKTTKPLNRLRRRATGAVALLAALALAAGCSTSSASGKASASGSNGSETTWTTISSTVATASTGASVSDILGANASVEKASSSEDDAGTTDTSSATTITLSGSSASASGSSSGNVKVDGGTVTINSGGTYVISGELSNGRIVVNAPKADVRLVLSGASITSSDGPAIDIQDAGDAIVVLAKDSKNTLTDGASYASGQEATAALFSSDTLTVTGAGQLDVTGSYKDGISSKNGLIITGSGTINVKADDDGLRGKDYLVVESGKLTVEAGGDALKSSEDNDETKGFISLGKASITLTSSDDAIAATTDVTVKDTTLTITAGGGQANATIEEQAPPGQESTADSTTPSPKGINAGVSYTQDSGTVTINAADEGLQAPFINVAGGELSIAAGDDGINASNGDHVIEGHENADSESDDGSVLTISGGEVEVSYASSDGIDSNGSAYVKGGIVVVSGQAGEMDGAVDANGETQLVGVTGSPSVSAGDTLTVTDSSGSQVASVKVDFTAAAITVLGLTEGQQYTVATSSGGSATGTASALSAGMGGPMGGGQGGQGGPGEQGGQPGGDPGQPPSGGQQPGNQSNQNGQSSSQSSTAQSS
ncbi:carbohydrate-binding domain-containing protein [Actinomyces johnsonii]|uniref:Carbohydrate-binding domain-containing protein n=1 Tax=Actinomyces johnsonii TaxID=544581 RepID=A0A507ZVN1_9ACTO|nr:carbohydrate-binding domain-containing protein [Actinomyces johnsonii]KAA8738323.1 carbohydrate-binding domain-containing protein [Actinomyces johnsonii]TQD41559.1 carbohydrate-binding domain-containing protein [Actinomyces johnsonii]